MAAFIIMGGRIAPEQVAGLDHNAWPTSSEYAYKAEFSISYADCFALASALENKATLVTGDPEFKKVEHLVKVIWV